MSGITQGVGGSYGGDVGQQIIQSGTVANDAIVAGQEGTGFAEGLAVASQGAGNIVGGDIGASVQNSGTQFAVATDAIQAGNGLDAFNAIGSGAGGIVGAAGPQSIG
jgi:hypothetical protein